MHILYVWSYWQYPELGIEFVNRTQKLGHKVSVYLARYDNDCKTFSGKGFDLYLGKKIDPINKLANLSYPILKQISCDLKKINPDVIHINSHLFFSNLQVAYAGHRMGIPVVVTVHGVMVNRNILFDTTQKLYLNTFARYLFNIASSIICLTENDARVVAEFSVDKKKIAIIPNGVDVDTFKPSVKRLEGQIVWVGRLVPEKGLKYLLNAMPKILSQVPDARLILVGDGACKLELQTMSEELGISDHVIFLGSVSRRIVAETVSESMVFAFPSLKEGLPFSVLEAMACGIPVVGSNIPGVAALVDPNETGLLVPPKDPQQLATSIVRLLKDRELNQQLGFNSRQKMLKKYTWNSNLSALNDIYMKLKKPQVAIK